MKSYVTSFCYAALTLCLRFPSLGLREAYAEISIEKWQTSEIRRLLKEVSGFLFGISMSFKLAQLQYRTYKEKTAYAKLLAQQVSSKKLTPSYTTQVLACARP